VMSTSFGSILRSGVSFSYIYLQRESSNISVVPATRQERKRDPVREERKGVYDGDAGDQCQ